MRKVSGKNGAIIKTVILFGSSVTFYLSSDVLAFERLLYKTALFPYPSLSARLFCALSNLVFSLP